MISYLDSSSQNEYTIYIQRIKIPLASASILGGKSGKDDTKQLFLPRIHQCMTLRILLLSPAEADKSISNMAVYI